MFTVEYRARHCGGILRATTDWCQIRVGDEVVYTQVDPANGARDMDYTKAIAYNLKASTTIWTMASLPDVWPGCAYYPGSQEFAVQVQAFQRAHGGDLVADARLGPATLDALNSVYSGQVVERLGMDVSRYQGAPAWPVVAGDARRFYYAIAKATQGRTGGGRHSIDPQLEHNAHGIHNAGLKLGYYVWVMPNTDSENWIADAKIEARDFMAAIKDLPQPDVLSFADGRQGDVWMDFEDAIPKLDEQQGLEWMLAWLYELEDAGFKPGWYSKDSLMDTEIVPNPEAWDKLLKRRDGSERPFMVAMYGTNDGQRPSDVDPNRKVPAAWGHWNAWQYTSRGSVQGIEGDVDLSVARLAPAGGVK